MECLLANGHTKVNPHFLRAFGFDLRPTRVIIGDT